ncbi:MAG: alpha/beta fold hydrolase [Pseudomonadota bacterium]
MSSRIHESGFDTLGTHYLRLGDADAPTILFIHGLGMAHMYWQPQLVALAERYHLIAYDLLGHGESPPPDDDVTLDDLVDQAHGLLHDLGVQTAHIVGHSMGGLIATGFALAHPQASLSLSVLNSVYDRPLEARRAAEERASQILANTADTRRDNGVEATIVRWFGDTPDVEHEELIDMLRQQLAANDPAQYGQIYRLFATSDVAFVGRLQALTCPALFMTGADDPNSTPAMSQRMADAAPHGHCIVFDDARHMMSLVDPARVTPELDEFISTVGSASTRGAAS